MENVMLTKEWPAVVDVHLFGGLRAACTPNKTAKFEPFLPSTSLPTLNIPEYKAIYYLLKQAGFSIVGADFVSNNLQTEGLMPPDWRTHHWSKTTQWACTENAHDWSFLAGPAWKKKEGRLWDISSRISQQINACERSLRNLSEDYYKQLRGLCGRGQFKDGSRMQDLFTASVYSSFQTFLIDACMLRDYLAEFAFWFVYKSSAPHMDNVTKFSTLYDNVLKKMQNNDELTANLTQAGNAGGWLLELNQYRNLILHVCLLPAASRQLNVVCQFLEIGGKRKFPFITCPIPSEPSKISLERKSKGFFEDFDKLVNGLYGATIGSIPSRDALEYAHTTLGSLIELSKLLIVKSPILPEMPVLTPNDTIGGFHYGNLS